MRIVQRLANSRAYLLDGRGVRFYPRARLTSFHWVRLSTEEAAKVAEIVQGQKERLPSLPGEEKEWVVVQGDEILGWMHDDNTRAIETSLPDLYSDDAAAVESWYLRWESVLPKGAREELAVLLVELDDRLLDAEERLLGESL